MIITISSQKEDKEMDEKVRSYGVRSAAKSIGVSPAYLSAVVRGQNPISLDKYNSLVELFENEDTQV